MRLLPLLFALMLPLLSWAQPLQEKLRVLPLGAVKPQGWLLAQMQGNLAGYTGHLDSLCPDLVVKDDIYGKDRLTRKVKSKSLGAVTDDAAGMDVQFVWWNSETQSNWWDGLIRTAVLTRDKPMLAKCSAYVKRILSYQDADGYLGIYDTAMRYRFDKENGELWAQTTLLRGLLGWYEYSKDKKVLTAIERAVDNVMQHYPAGKSHPFYSTSPYVGGLSHGLMLTDVLERLTQLTGKEKWRAYSVFLYRDFSAATLAEDAQLAKVLDPGYQLTGHGVHTYEHLRALAAAYYASGNDTLRRALEAYQEKIAKEILPSGAPVGDEWVGKREADATNTGYEYCSIHELMHGWVDLAAKTGKAEYGQKAEWLFYNAAQGARHPTEPSIAYCKTDNSYRMAGYKNLDSADRKQVRYKYSPVHQDAAVCCVPNAGRIAPYFVQHMWMQDKDGLVAELLGPCEVEATVKGKKVWIKEEALASSQVANSYGWLTFLRCKVRVSDSARFAIRIRKPVWCTRVVSKVAYQEKDGYLVIDRFWKGGWTDFEMEFKTDVQLHQVAKGEVWFSYGPLVLAQPIGHKDSVGKRFSYYDRELYVKNAAPLRVYQYTGAMPTVHCVPFCALPGSDDKTAADRKECMETDDFDMQAFDPVTSKPQMIQLKPIGKTTLRQVTFPSKL